VTFVVTHGTGDLDGYEGRVTDIAREEGGPEAIAISGHTHQLTDTTVAGTRLLDPGSATGAAPANRATMLTVDVAEGAVDVTHHER
jgi:predicted phosphodiesterase